jgi:hypothetical protein
MPAWLSNLLAFQAGWWAVVLSAAQGIPALGLALVAGLLAWHLLWVRPLRSEAILIGLTCVIGLAADSLFLASGWVGFATEGPIAGMAPLWMAALWANFACTLNVALVFLRGHAWLASALGAIAGPLAYWGGAELGAMTFRHPVTGLAGLAVVWAVLTPLLVVLGETLDRRIRP